MANHIISLLRSVYRRPCVDHQALRNPVELWLAGGGRYHRAVRRRSSTPAEVLPRWWAAIEAEVIVPATRDIFWFGIYTGMRRGEIMALCWDRVDLERWILRVEETKTGEPLELPVTRQLAVLLERRRLEASASNGGAQQWVFPSTGASGHAVELQHLYRRISRAAGTKFWFHGLRNVFITVAERELMLPRSLTKRLVNHARGSDVTESYAADWSVASRTRPAHRGPDRRVGTRSRHGSSGIRPAMAGVRRSRGGWGHAIRDRSSARVTHPAGSLPSPAGAGRLWSAMSDDESFICRLSLDRLLTLVAGLAAPSGASAEVPGVTTEGRDESQPTQCAYIGTGEGRLRPPSNPRHPAPLREQRADRGHRPPNPLIGAPMAERRTVRVHVRVSPAELAAWRAKAATVGVPLSDLLRQAMARTRTWTAAAAAIERERTRQIARIGNNLNQLARWADTHGSAVEAVAVIANLVGFERTLRTVAHLGREADDAH